MQDRDSYLFYQIVIEVMHRITGNGYELSPGLFQVLACFDQYWYQCLIFGQDGLSTVRYLRVIIDDYPQVVLVSLGWVRVITLAKKSTVASGPIPPNTPTTFSAIKPPFG